MFSDIDILVNEFIHLQRSQIGREFESVEALWSRFDSVLSQRQTTETRPTDEGESANNNGRDHRMTENADAEMT